MRSATSVDTHPFSSSISSNSNSLAYSSHFPWKCSWSPRLVWIFKALLIPGHVEHELHELLTTHVYSLEAFEQLGVVEELFPATGDGGREVHHSGMHFH